MAGQENAIEAGAEMVLALAQEAGERCGCDKSVAAARILEVAYAMAIADMIGPGFSIDRMQTALDMMSEKLVREVPLQHALRHGRFAIGGRA